MGSSDLRFGALIGAIIQFLLIALVVYFALVVPMNYLRKQSFLKHGTQPEADTPPSELELLTQIRDLLAAPTSGGESPAVPGTPQSSNLPSLAAKAPSRAAGRTLTQVTDVQRWLPQCGGLSARRRASFSFSA